MAKKNLTPEKESAIDGITIADELNDKPETVIVGWSNKNLNGANLYRCDLSGADLSGFYLCEANMAGSMLANTNLTGAYLQGANLPGANLHGAILPGANMQGVNLNGADLSNSDLSWADLTGANLSLADLSGTNLNSTKLSGVDLSGAKGILSISNLGTYEETLYIVQHETCLMVKSGKFWGTLGNFTITFNGKNAINKSHDIYRAAIKFIKIWEKENR